jgi:hypothetical protein
VMRPSGTSLDPPVAAQSRKDFAAVALDLHLGPVVCIEIHTLTGPDAIVKT